MQLPVTFYLRKLSKPRFLPHECNEQSSCGTQVLIPQQSYFFLQHIRYYGALCRQQKQAKNVKKPL